MARLQKKYKSAQDVRLEEAISAGAEDATAADNRADFQVVAAVMGAGDGGSSYTRKQRKGSVFLGHLSAAGTHGTVSITSADPTL